VFLPCRIQQVRLLLEPAAPAASPSASAERGEASSAPGARCVGKIRSSSRIPHACAEIRRGIQPPGIDESSRVVHSIGVPHGTHGCGPAAVWVHVPRHRVARAVSCCSSCKRSHSHGSGSISCWHFFPPENIFFGRTCVYFARATEVLSRGRVGHGGVLRHPVPLPHGERSHHCLRPRCHFRRSARLRPCFAPARRFFRKSPATHSFFPQPFLGSTPKDPIGAGPPTHQFAGLFDGRSTLA